MTRVGEIIRELRTLSAIYGFDPVLLVKSLAQTPKFIRDYVTFSRMKRGMPDWPLAMPYPCFNDRGEHAGAIKTHYFHQDLLVAGRIHARNPVRHIDVGSRIDGFVAHVASFRPIEIMDIRPLDVRIPNVSFLQADLMRPAQDGEGICDSLSCLHALEHFGLGRYGDTLDANGHASGFANLVRLLVPGGIFYFSVPIGPQRVAFNAHRVFGLPYLVTMFEKNGLTVEAFAYVDDCGDLHDDQPLSSSLVSTNCGVRYGCGIFELKRSSDVTSGL
jgi:SAM-dependent methyltransferase